MRRNSRSNLSLSSHLDLSKFKNVIKPSSTALTPTKNKLFSFSKKAIDSSEIKQAGSSLSSRLEDGFRFVAHVEYANNSFLAFMDLQKKQTEFAVMIKSAIESLGPFEAIPVIARIVNALKGVGTVAADLEITDSVDTPIISRIASIEQAHLEYLSAYAQLTSTELDQVHQKLNFVLEGLQSILLAPFQRILDYRYFLRRVYMCDQHLCDKRGCKSRSCPLKMKMDSMNNSATKRLSQSIRECYSLFNLVDNFPGLVEWEDKLNTSKCESLGPIDSEYMNIDLHLTVPYRSGNQKMAELPTLLYSELFQLVPLTSDDSKFSLRSHKKEKSNTILRLNLFTDFILITAEDGIDNQLLFPPMPTSHISVEAHLGNVMALKLSPFKMLLLQPCIQSNGTRLLELFNERMTTKLNEKIESITQASSQDVYKTFCRPFIWRLAAEGSSNEFEWARLSKSDLTLKVVDNDIITLSLNAEGTGRSLFNAKITPATLFSQVAPKRLELTATDSDGIMKKLIIQVVSTSVLSDLMEELERVRMFSLEQTFKKCKFSFSALPAWASSVSSLKIKELGIHCGVLVQAEGGWTPLGPATSFIIMAGPEDECSYLRLYVQSTLNQSITFLELDLGKAIWSSRKEGNDIILRVFRSDSRDFIDYFLDLRLPECEKFDIDLQSFGREARFIEERLQESARKQEELVQQLELELQRLAVAVEAEETAVQPVASILSTMLSPPQPQIEEAESVLSLVETIHEKANEIGTSGKESILKVSDSSTSLVMPEHKPTMDFELDSLMRELRQRERETRKLYSEFCALDDEKKRIVKRLELKKFM